MKDYFLKLAHYNQWANTRLYEACSTLSPSEYMQDRKAFFNSIHGTLNHLLACDRLWFGRLMGIHSGITSLNQNLCNEFDSLLQARQIQDHAIIEFIDQLDPEKISTTLHFKTLAEKDSSMPMQLLLGHVFNHQTHHRGQVHNMLSQAGISPPPLDLYYFILE